MFVTLITEIWLNPKYFSGTHSSSTTTSPSFSTIFPRLALVAVACLPALYTCCMFSRARHRLNVFPCLAPVTCFPALGTGCMFSLTWDRLHVFSHLTPVACFPTLGIGCVFSSLGIAFIFSLTWHRLHVFLHFALVPCFPAFGTDCMPSRAWNWFQVFSRLLPAAYMYFCSTSDLSVALFAFVVIGQMPLSSGGAGIAKW